MSQHFKKCWIASRSCQFGKVNRLFQSKLLVSEDEMKYCFGFFFVLRSRGLVFIGSVCMAEIEWRSI